MNTRGDWILVRSMDELFVGCAVRMTNPCQICGQRHLGNITSGLFVEDGRRAVNASLICPAAARLLDNPAGARATIYEVAIAKRCIERLRPDETADESTTSKRTRVPAEVR